MPIRKTQIAAFKGLESASSNTRRTMIDPTYTAMWDMPTSAYLCQMVYWAEHDTHSDPEGWIYKPVEESECEIGVKDRTLSRIRTTLKNAGILECEMRGIPARPYHRINFAALLEAREKFDAANPDLAQKHRVKNKAARPAAPHGETVPTDDKNGGCTSAILSDVFPTDAILADVHPPPIEGCTSAILSDDIDQRVKIKSTEKSNNVMSFFENPDQTQTVPLVEVEALAPNVGLPPSETVEEIRRGTTAAAMLTGIENSRGTARKSNTAKELVEKTLRAVSMGGCELPRKDHTAVEVAALLEAGYPAGWEDDFLKFTEGKSAQHCAFKTSRGEAARFWIEGLAHNYRAHRIVAGLLGGEYPAAWPTYSEGARALFFYEKYLRENGYSRFSSPTGTGFQRGQEFIYVREVADIPPEFLKRAKVSMEASTANSA